MLRGIFSRLRLCSQSPEDRNTVKPGKPKERSKAVVLAGSTTETQISLDQFVPPTPKRKLPEDICDASCLHEDHNELRPRKKLVRRSSSFLSATSTSNSTCDSELSSTPPATSDVFRYYDLPAELRLMVIEFAFELEEATRLPSYDYLIPEEDPQGSGSFVRGYRLWLTPRLQLQQLLVSRMFLQEAIEVVAKLSPIEVQTVYRIQVGRGGAEIGGQPLRKFMHPRKQFEGSLLQKILTEILRFSQQLDFKQSDSRIPKEILDLVTPLMPSLKRIEVTVAHELVWIRTGSLNSAPHGALSWLGLNTLSFRLRSRALKVALLTVAEYKDIKTGLYLPEPLCKVLAEDKELLKCNAEAARFKKTFGRKEVSDSLENQVTSKPRSLNMVLIFSISAFLLKPEANDGSHKIITIFVKFDGKDYTVTNLRVCDDIVIAR